MVTKKKIRTSPPLRKPSRPIAWYFSVDELELMRDGLQALLDGFMHEGKPIPVQSFVLHELLEDLKLCIAGKL